MRSYDKDAYLTGEGVLTKDLIAIAGYGLQAGRRRLYRRRSSSSSPLSSPRSPLPILLVGGIELAIFINMAIPFFTGEAIPFIASIVIGCIQLGVTIDYAILLVTRFKEELRKGSGQEREAMRDRPADHPPAPS